MSERRVWYVVNTGNHQSLIIDEKTGVNIAVCYDKVDAPIIAAAPDLLAACREALNAATVKLDTYAASEARQKEVVDLIEAAITKAIE